MSISAILKTIETQKIKFIDLRFTDARGKEHHISLPASVVNETLFTEGKMFDGSSIAGWKRIHNSDTVLLPDASTAVIDPFCEEVTLNLRCDV